VDAPGPARRQRRRHAGRGETLPLLPPPAALPGPIRPEWAVPCAGPFDADEWRFSVDWDGTRALLVTGTQGEARLQDGLLRDVGARFPEVVEAADALGRRSAVLDGVVSVVDGDGRPDLDALWARSAALPSAGAVVYLASDLLHLDGRSTMSWPLDRRHETLSILVPPHACLQVPGWVAGHGRAFCDAAAEHELPAVLARRGAATYRPGVASPERLRISLEERADAVVAGIVHAGRPSPGRRRPSPPPAVVALLLAEWVDGRLDDAGRAAGPTSPRVAAWLWGRASEMAAPAPPGRMAAAPGEAVAWLQPRLVATVRHHGRDDAGRLRLPAVLAVRDDVDPAWCVRRQPVPVPADRPAQGVFRPTVLRTLPLI